MAFSFTLATGLVCLSHRFTCSDVNGISALKTARTSFPNMGDISRTDIDSQFGNIAGVTELNNRYIVFKTENRYQTRSPTYMTLSWFNRKAKE